ncbi:MAG: flagellar motor switch protein FliG, partial [Armatimonadota bacterium]
NKTREKVLEECRRELREQVNLGGLDYARSILENVLGPAKTQELLGKLTSSGAGNFRWLRSVNPNQLATVLRGEKPQVVALVLGHLPPEIAAMVISSLPEKLAGEVALRLTTMQPTDPEVVKHLDKVLLSQLSLGDNASLTEVGGTKSVVEILNLVDRSTEKKILDHLAEVDEKIANEIKEMMFVFEDILGLDDRSIQTILRDVPQEDLRLALKGVSNEIREVFFRNMSQRAAESLKEDLEVSGPVRLKDVESAQSRISNIARALDEKGEISIRGRSDDVVV